MKHLPAIFAVATVALLSVFLFFYVAFPDPIVVRSFGSATIVGFFAWAFFARKGILKALQHKSTRYGANISLVIFLVFGILVAINFLGKRNNWRKDLTRGSVNSLSPQAVKVLRDLKDEVKLFYFGALADKERNESLMKNFARESKNLKYEFVDTDRRPTFSQTMDVRRKDTVVLVLSGTEKKIKIEGATEEKITNGLVQLLKKKTEVIYFSSGHGEREWDNPDHPLGISSLKKELEKQGYVVKAWNGISQGAIPTDAAVLVVLGPTKAFFPKELDLISEWSKIGKLLVAVDLDPTQSGLTKGSLQMAELLKQFGLIVNREMLVDPTSKAANVEPQVLLGFSGSKEHPITKDFAASNMAANFLFPLTTYLQVVPVEEKIEATILANTSRNAWAESDWGSLRTGLVKYEPGKDHQGQMALAYALEGEKNKNRLVVFATSTFVANSLIDKVGNRDFFLNAVAWLTNEEGFISIRPKEEQEGIKEVNNGVLNLVLLISVFVMPLIIISIGTVIWMRRKKL